MLKTLSAYKFIPVIASTILVWPLVSPTRSAAFRSQQSQGVSEQVKKAEDVGRSSKQILQGTNDLISEANTLAGAINNCSLAEVDETVSVQMSDLVRHISKAADVTGKIKSVLAEDGQLNKVKNDLDAQTQSLEKLLGDSAQTLEADQKEKVTATKGLLDKESQNVGKQRKLLDDAKKNLTDKALGVYGKVSELIGRLINGHLKPPASINDQQSDKDLLKSLAPALSQFQLGLRVNRDVRARWDEISPSLKQIDEKSHGEKEEKIKNALTSCDKQASDLIKKLPEWLKTIEGFVTKESETVRNLLNNLQQEPLTYSSEASMKIEADVRFPTLLNQFDVALQGLVELLRGTTIAGFDLDKTLEVAKSLRASAFRLDYGLKGLQDGLAGDYSRFVADQVTLYYFTDVGRLMAILNSTTKLIGGLQGAQEQAAEARRKLTETELALADAQGEVSKYQTRELTLKEELRRSQASFTLAEDLLRRSTNGLQKLRRNHADAESRVTRATANLNLAPDDPARKQELEQAIGQRDQASALVNDAGERLNETQRDRDATAEQFNSVKDEQDGLPAKIRAVHDKLEQAQAAVTQERKEALLYAQAESEAFVRARDNASYWFAPAVATSPDPARRVIMYAFADTKTVFLRGKPEDLVEVKNLIAKFDRPAPQARMTLWALELNSDTSLKGARHFNRALEIIEQELLNNRIRIARALSLLRDCINEKVNEAAENSGWKSTTKGVGILNPKRLARLDFYEEEITAHFGLNAKNDLNRIQFAYDILPDPAGTTTLAEALMILSLAKRKYQRDILKTFDEKLIDSLKGTETELYPEEKASANSCMTSLNARKDRLKFDSLRWALGVARETKRECDNPTKPDGITHTQLEIANALERVEFQRRLDQMLNIGAEIERIQIETNRAETEKVKVRDQLQNIDSKSEHKRQPLKEQSNKLDEKKDQNTALLTLLRQFLQNSIIDLGLDFEITLPSSNLRGIPIDINLVKLIQRQFPAGADNARVAAADEMLKRLIVAVEDDLEGLFVQPMVSCLKSRLQQDKHISVGIVQRTSVLATNRLLARVESRASAELPVGEQQDILQAAQQLAQLFLTTSAGALGGLLKPLNALPRDEHQKEIYGVTANSVFHVTPIFDPTGQALRFKFDHIAATPIREPDGSTSPQLPHVHRHSVNTEVQISNLELREVSRFDSNVKLGAPVQTWGGIPVLNNIPYVRELPLIGWFVKKGGQAAAVQQSLIFAQTTMYPTILDILNLLSPSKSNKLPGGSAIPPAPASGSN